MFEKDPFSQRINARSQATASRKKEASRKQSQFQEAARRKEAATAAELASQRRARLQAIYDQPRTATSPEAVFSKAETDLCAEFIAHMNKKIFKKSVRISEHLPANGPSLFRTNWSMDAYQIGRLELAQRTLFSELYLCKDGLLRRRVVTNPNVLITPPHTARMVRYEGLPESSHDISFGSYSSRAKETVRIIPPRYQNNMGPEGFATTGYDESRIVTKTNEVFWQGVNSLEDRLIQIATSKHQPLVENG